MIFLSLFEFVFLVLLLEIPFKQPSLLAELKCLPVEYLFALA